MLFPPLRKGKSAGNAQRRLTAPVAVPVLPHFRGTRNAVDAVDALPNSVPKRHTGSMPVCQ